MYPQERKPMIQEVIIIRKIKKNNIIVTLYDLFLIDIFVFTINHYQNKFINECARKKNC